MNPNIKTLCFAIVFLEMVGGLLGLRFEQLVRFSCEICAPEPNECCVGSVIHKDVILTTSYCATSCQSIHKYDRNINIIRTYKQPRMETKTRHDIALVIINIDWKLRWTAKLSSGDALSAVGLKAYYPYMEDGNTRMREMIVQTCGKQGQRIYGNHVCGVKNNNKETKKCFQRQGVPLVMNGKIMALTAATNNKLCNQEQIVFNTIDPELAWINSTIAELYPDDRLNEVDSDPPPNPDRASLATSTQIPDTTTSVPTTTTVPTRTAITNATQKPIPTRTLSPTDTTILLSSLLPIEHSETKEAAVQEMVTEVQPISAHFRNSGFPIFSTQQTDAMEWFNQKVRNKLKSGNQSFFVLTTSKQMYGNNANSPFVDLTV